MHQRKENGKVIKTVATKPLTPGENQERKKNMIAEQQQQRAEFEKSRKASKVSDKTAAKAATDSKPAAGE
jgi:hypothetical protein